VVYDRNYLQVLSAHPPRIGEHRRSQVALEMMYMVEVGYLGRAAVRAVERWLIVYDSAVLMLTIAL
jgi:hypothetical protein